MWKRILVFGGALLLSIGLFVLVATIQKSKDRRALQAYIAELRARGEPLTWDQLGYPPAGEANPSLGAFLTAVNKLGGASQQPGRLEYMNFIGPGTAVVAWAASRPLASSLSSQAKAPRWDDVLADMRTSSNALAEVRAFLRTPPRYFPMNLTNPLLISPRNPFVEKRIATQWLAADSLAALHVQDLERARADLHALTQLIQMHRDDPTLVNAMIRVAISGLTLSACWDALQTQGWREGALERLQEDWEQIDLIDALERGIVGERISALQYFENPDLMIQLQTAVSTGPRGAGRQGVAGFRDDVLATLANAYWRGHREQDQLLYLQLKQDRLDLLRQLKTNAPGVNVRDSIQAEDNVMQSELQGIFFRYSHLLTSMAMPTYSRAIETVMRTETQRRMTILAIALQRYHLRTGQFPSTLDDLVPEYISECLIDPMSGQPFGYRRNPDASFTLYSVGEDGVDDGGDATARVVSGGVNLWSGKDAVWPTALQTDQDPTR